MADWYHDITLIQALDQVVLPEWDEDGPVWVPILDEQRDEKGEIMASGRVENGTLWIGEKLFLAPHLANCQVKYILNSKDKIVWYALPGENVRIALHGIEDNILRKGYCLSSWVEPIPVSNHILANLEILILEKNEVISTGF